MLPYFYHASAGGAGDELTLDEDNSRHIVQVLRMKPGEELLLTNGMGFLLTATIIDDHKKKCRVRVSAVAISPPPGREIAIAIPPLKNASRFEWFLEKATEIGVRVIIPLLSERTERQHTKPERWQSILVSAMLQSQQTWLPKLGEAISFSQLIASAMEGQRRSAGMEGRRQGMEEQPQSPGMEGHRQSTGMEGHRQSPGMGIGDIQAERRLIAHCLEAPRPTDHLADVARDRPSASTLILIGPEGDFSSKEVETALAAGFLPVTLGENRLRTETAGIVAATLLCIG